MVRSKTVCTRSLYVAFFVLFFFSCSLALDEVGACTLRRGEGWILPGRSAAELQYIHEANMIKAKTFCFCFPSSIIVRSSAGESRGEFVWVVGLYTT